MNIQEAFFFLPMFFLVFYFFQTKRNTNTTNFFSPEIVAWLDTPSRHLTGRQDWTLFCPNEAFDTETGKGLMDLWGEDFERPPGPWGNLAKLPRLIHERVVGCKLSYLSFEFSWILEKWKYVYSVLWMIFLKLFSSRVFKVFVYKEYITYSFSLAIISSGQGSWPGISSRRMTDVQLITIQGINVSHLGKRKIIFKRALVGDMLVSRRVYKNPCPTIFKKPTDVAKLFFLRFQMYFIVEIIQPI